MSIFSDLLKINAHTVTQISSFYFHCNWLIFMHCCRSFHAVIMLASQLHEHWPLCKKLAWLCYLSNHTLWSLFYCFSFSQISFPTLLKAAGQTETQGALAYFWSEMKPRLMCCAQRRHLPFKKIYLCKNSQAKLWIMRWWHRFKSEVRNWSDFM